VRDEILRTFAQTRTVPVSGQRLDDAKANARYSFVRGLDNTEAIAATLARFVHYDRDYDTINKLYRLYSSLTPEDIQGVAKKYFVDRELVVTTLSHGELPGSIRTAPALSTFAAAPAAKDLSFVRVRSALPQLDVKLLFTVGSAQDPPGKEGLAALAGAMIAEAGSKERRIDEINRALYPMAGSFHAQVDKEMTTFTSRSTGTTGRPFSMSCSRSCSTRASARRTSSGCATPS
jgi:zinc protease